MLLYTTKKTETESWVDNEAFSHLIIDELKNRQGNGKQNSNGDTDLFVNIEMGEFSSRSLCKVLTRIASQIF